MEAEGEPICRICFAGAGSEEEGSQELVSPCRCEGSQKYVHLRCLRHWQRVVQLGGSNHPDDVAREERHLVCNVCKAPFNLPPQDRASMMSDLASMRADQVAPGMLLVTKKTDAEAPEPSAQMNIELRALIEIKAAHFRQAVYILTDVHPAEDSPHSPRSEAGGSDVVVGVNLSRPLEPPDVSKLAGAADKAAIKAWRRKGVEVMWMNGGPVKPREVTCLACVASVPAAQRAALLAQHGAKELISGEQAVVHGPMPGLLALAAEEASAAAAAGRPRAAVVLAWAGFAQWDRTQLLGEIARGSWGWCRGATADVAAAVEAQRPRGAESLWTAVRYSERLCWAPENELSREFERRFPSRPREGEQRELDRHAEAVGALVRRYEVVRRGGEPSHSSWQPWGARSRSAEAGRRPSLRQAPSCAPQ